MELPYHFVIQKIVGTVELSTLNWSKELYDFRMDLLARLVKNIFGFAGLHISKKPLKYYYEVEAHVIESLLRASTGVIHIGGHFGQEADFYNEIGKKVIWIEGLPKVHEQLSINISKFDNQISYCAILGDKECPSVEINLSNNDFSASSIFDIHPNSGFKGVKMQGKISLPMTTLDQLLDSKDCSDFNHWVIDVQGAELLVLKGAMENLKNCNSIVVEVSSRPTYLGGVEYKELKEFLGKLGFTSLWEPLKNDHTNIPFIRF